MLRDLFIFNFIEPVLINNIKDEHFLNTSITKLVIFYLPTCVLKQINNKYN